VPTRESLASNALRRIKLQNSETIYTLPEWDVLIIFRDLLRLSNGKRIRGSPARIEGIDHCCPFDEEGFARGFSPEEYVELREWIFEKQGSPAPIRTSPLYSWESHCWKTLRFWSRYFEVSSLSIGQNFRQVLTRFDNGSPSIPLDLHLNTSARCR